MTKLGGLNTTRVWSEVLADLEDELFRWNMEDYVLPTLKRSRDERVVTLRLAKRGQWFDIRCGAFTAQTNGLVANLLAIKMAVEANRKADQRGIGSVFAEVAKLLALGDPEDPYHVLGVSHGAPISSIRSAYTEAIKRSHPDRGGNDADFQRIKAAGDKLGVS